MEAIPSDRRRRAAIVIFVVLAHLLALYGLARAFAPNFVASLEQQGLEAITVVTPLPPEPTPEPTPEARPDEGAQGAPGRQAVARPIEAPPVAIPLQLPSPIPMAASTGEASRSGAADTGEGTGAAGVGTGTGSGFGGVGGGGSSGIATRPSVRAGSVSERDFGIPPGGRSTRFGKKVVVVFDVTTSGMARNCSVRSTEVDADTTAAVCPLVIRTISFNPARTADGVPVEARYGYMVEFDERRDP